MEHFTLCKTKISSYIGSPKEFFCCWQEGPWVCTFTRENSSILSDDEQSMLIIYNSIWFYSNGSIHYMHFIFIIFAIYANICNKKWFYAKMSISSKRNQSIKQSINCSINRCRQWWLCLTATISPVRTTPNATRGRTASVCRAGRDCCARYQVV